MYLNWVSNLAVTAKCSCSWPDARTWEHIRVFSSWREWHCGATPINSMLPPALQYCHFYPLLLNVVGLEKAFFLKAHFVILKLRSSSWREVCSTLKSRSQCPGSQKLQVQIQMGLTHKVDKLSFLQLFL